MFKPSLELLEDRTMPSYVLAAPEFLAVAAKDVQAIGQFLSSSQTAAAISTTSALAAAEDEVAAAVSAAYAAAYGFETAFPSTVFPSLAATESHYMAMWGQNVASMVGSAAPSAAAPTQRSGLSGA